MTTKTDLQLSNNEKDQLITELECEISEMTEKYKAAIAKRKMLQSEQSELLKMLIE